MDLVILGYLLHDVLRMEGERRELLGGSAAYAGIFLSRLGRKVGIVTKVGRDFKYWKEMEGCGLSFTYQNKTTCFENTYARGKRYQKVYNVGGKIDFGDIPRNYLETGFFYLAPVMGEIPFECVKKLREKGKIFMGVQGFLRYADRSRVKNRRVDEIMDYLELADVVAISGEEAGEIQLQDKIILITYGKRGSVAIWEGKKERIPAFPVREVDPTGAGDVYLAAFIHEFLSTRDVYRAALFASASASIVVEGYGVEPLLHLDREKLYSRYFTLQLSLPSPEER
jgi:hypothetical protein